MGASEPSPTDTAGTASAVSLRRFTRLGCLILLLLGAVIAYVSYQGSAERANAALDAEIKRLRAADIIVPVESLIPQVPPGERNAADVYQKAFHALQPVSSDDERALFGEPWDAPDRLQVLMPAVEKNATYFALLDEASSLPHSAFPVDWSRARDCPPTLHLKEFNDVGRWQQWRAQALLTRGNADAALQCAMTLLRTAEHVQREPTDVAEVIALLLHAQACGTVRTVLCAADPCAETCRALFQALERVDNVGPSVTGLRARIAIYQLPLFQQLREGDWTERMDALRNDYERAWHRQVFHFGIALGGGVVVPTAICRHLRYQERLIDAYSRPWPELRAVLRKESAELAALPASQAFIAHSLEDPEAELRYVLMRERVTAVLRLAQVGLAAAAYRAERGHYPTSVEHLAGDAWDLPEDPFGSGPLHYRREPDGFTVWSVGPNLLDDNTAEYKSDSMSREDGPYDIVFRCQR